MAELKKILVVEDEQCISDVVFSILQDGGIDGELATTFEEAMQALNREGDYSGSDFYDALLVDMSILTEADIAKGVDIPKGADIAKIARGMDPEKRIVMFSGYYMNDAIEGTRHLGNIGYLKKPFDVKNLIPALKGEHTDYVP